MTVKERIKIPNADLEFLLQHGVTKYKIAKYMRVQYITVRMWQLNVNEPLDENKEKLKSLRAYFEQNGTLLGYPISPIQPLDDVNDFPDAS